jgi:hypothetical protein
MPNTAETIKALNGIDLCTYPYYEVQEHIRSFGKTGFLIFTLHKGKTIVRARSGSNFRERSELSFLPQAKNTKCQRASTPNKTMFYASLVSEQQSFAESRILAANETSTLLRKGIESNGIEKITYGRWSVIDNIDLVVILDEDVYKTVNNNPLLSELKKAYNTFIQTTPELEEKTRLIANFFAKEFSKEQIGNDYDYFLSAIFSEFVVTELNYDGVMYPSVQAGGQIGFNVAIKPEVVNRRLQLDLIAESTLYKKKDKSLIVIDKISTPLTWEYYERIEIELEQILAQLQINSLEELL